ncbi:hypothetical protein TRIUR3_33301 [Triticum urartu]|uniref:Uncharacterized protein n=1 Tax=Triticum urartu TaxID=4572 RepID=M7ZXW2_TRIUA|nr:hypothetical protein TRIUR3_33301 [Triticum urartu]
MALKHKKYPRTCGVGGSTANGKCTSEPRVRWPVQHEEDHSDNGEPQLANSI